MKRKLPETINQEEFEQLVEAVNEPHHAIALMLGFHEGLRVSEIVHLKPENIKGEWIHIKEGKGKKDRIVPLLYPIDEQQLKDNLPMPCGIRALQKMMTLLSERILKRRISMHTLRHSFATYWLNDRGKDIRHIQKFLGHASIRTTQIYTHVNPEDLRREFV